METKLDTISEWHRILKARDLSRLASLLADEVVFFSPVVHTPQSGELRTLKYLTAAFHVFLNDSFRYVREVKGENDAVLEFVVDLDGITVNGVDMIKWNDDGLICEFKVMLRPLKAVNLIHAKMAEMLAAHSAAKQ
ncbi:nuclear transport factor 2 family protein [soil metagenome]